MKYNDLLARPSFTKRNIIKTRYMIKNMIKWHLLLKVLKGETSSYKVVSGGKPKGSKHNLKFPNATWPQAPSQ
jgi:hypothetical protein